MLEIIKETEQQVYDMYDTAVQQEKEWAWKKKPKT